jgi:hypothetical protein
MFKGSKSLTDKSERIKNTGKLKENASFLFKKTLNRKKKKIAINIFIIPITKILDGGIKKEKEAIKPINKHKNISFLPYFSLASIINFNYNRKLWLKLKK